MDISYIINELGEDREQYFGSVAPPIFQTSMFAFKTTAQMREALQNEAEIPFYTRGNNPTTTTLQQKIAALENAEDALMFASGSAAVAAAVMANVAAGDHVVCVLKPYSWTNKLLNLLLTRFGVQTTMVDGSEIAHFEAAIQANTKLIFLESPNSWTFEQQDLVAVAALAKKHQILTIIDNSCASPLYQNPIGMGIDMTVHSATKYLGGHSDTVAGVVCGSKEMMRKIFHSEFMTLGATLSPFNAWLLLRGLRTLPIRLERVSQSTAEVIQYLAQHPKVERIFYPFYEGDPQFELSKKQMCKGAGQFTIALKAENIAEVERFCDGLSRFLLACSWGSYESLIFPACTLYTSENYQNNVLHWSWIRFYVGLEEPQVLIADLEKAFVRMNTPVAQL